MLTGVDIDMESNFIEQDITKNEIDINHDILYKPNKFHVPKIPNKAKIQQANKNILVNDSQSIQQEDTLQQNHQSNIENEIQNDIQSEIQQQLYENIDYELNDNDTNELSTLLNINNNENDNQEINKEFEPYLAETNENYTTNELPKA